MRRSGVFWARVRVLGGVGILALLVWRLGSGAFVTGLRVLDGPTLLAAVGIGAVTTVGSAWRWCLVARALGLRLRVGPAVADYYRALFLNAALPGGVLGDVHRAVRHGRDTGDVRRGVRAVLLERCAGQVTLALVAAVVLLSRPSPVLSQAALDTVARPAAIALAGTGLALVALRGIRRRRRAVAAPAATIPTATASTATTSTATTPTPTRPTPTRPAPTTSTATIPASAAPTATIPVARPSLAAGGTWPKVAFSSVVVLAGHLATFLLAARAAGSSAPVLRLAPMMVLALLAMALPVNIGGWGPREGVTAWAFGAAGLSADLGLTVAVVYGLLAFAASLPGAVVLAARWLADRPAASAPAPTVPAVAVAARTPVGLVGLSALPEPV